MEDTYEKINVIRNEQYSGQEETVYSVYWSLRNNTQSENETQHYNNRVEKFCSTVNCVLVFI